MYFPQNWINKLFSEENKVLRTPFEARRWQGPPPINKVEQDEIVLLFEVSLFTQFIQSWRQNELLSLVCLCIKKNPKNSENQSVKIFWLKIQISSSLKICVFTSPTEYKKTIFTALSYR